MKKFKVTLTAELDLPDDFELADDPTDGYRCLKQGSNYYHPTFQWMHRKHYLEAGVLKPYESAPSVGWEAADDQTADRLFAASITKKDLCTEYYQIDPL